MLTKAEKKMAGKPCESIAEKVKPLRGLSGAETVRMGAELSDAMLKILVTSLKREHKLRKLEEILWGERR